MRVRNSDTSFSSSNWALGEDSVAEVVIDAFQYRGTQNTRHSTLQYCARYGPILPTPGPRPQARRAARRGYSMSATSAPSASALVSPGDSMPNRFTRPGTPCTAGPWTTKSVMAPCAPKILGRMPA